MSPPDARHEKCRKCGKVWNVSVYTEVPEIGYLCPTCELKELLQRRSHVLEKNIGKEY